MNGRYQMSERKTKLNCWEFKKCGRQPQGYHVHDLGVCPAATEDRLDGVHEGTNAGRACWIVSGTFCKGEVQGSFAKKMGSCESCEFYQQVRDDEDTKFELSITLLNRIRDKAKTGA